MLVLAIVLSPLARGRWAILLRNLIAWLSIAMIVMACPPLPWVMDAVFLAAFAAWFCFANVNNLHSPWLKLRVGLSLILLLLLLASVAIEFRHRRMPEILMQPEDNLVVIGDSVSSGIDPRVPSWPAILQQLTGVPVKNLARPGATTAEGVDMARGITPADHFIIVELGGNDLLSGVPSEEFGRALELLLAKVSKPGRAVIMFELPLIPTMIAYGQIQRRLASKYGAYLIPKRFFVRVIAGASATSDGIHLTELGVRRMAELVTRTLSIVPKPRA